MSTELVKFGTNLSTEVTSYGLSLSGLQEVNTPTGKAIAEGLLQAAKKTRKAVEGIRLEVTRTFDEKKKQAIQLERDLTKQLDEEIDRVEAMINKFNNDELRRVREEEAKIRQEAQEATNRKRSPQGIASVQIVEQAKLQAVEKPTGIKTTWVVKGINVSSLPKEYLTADVAKIKEAVASGVRNIPGVTLEEVAGRTGR